MMNNLTSKKIFKTISLMLVIIFITNVFIPIYSYAEESNDEKTGGKLFNPIFKFFAAVGDLVIKGLQYMFIGDGDIRQENLRKARK